MASTPANALTVYQQLLAHGYSTIQAIGIMANMWHESGFNPEANAMDSNGARSYGLVQWNSASYPNAHTYVTGNVSADIQRQVSALVSQAGPGSPAARGSTASQVAGNWAANFERCVGCQPGGAQYNSRSAFASTIEDWVKSGNWTQSAGTTAAVSSTPAQVGESSPGGNQGSVDNPVQTTSVWSKGFNWITGNEFGPVGSTVSGIAGAAKGISEISNQLSNIAHLMALLFQPAFWLRVGAFFIGLLALIGGLMMLKKTAVTA